AVRRGGVPPGDPGGLLGKPAEELGCIGDLAARFGKRLAHFKRHQQGQVVDPGCDQLVGRSEEHTSELQSRFDIVCRLLLEKKTSEGSSYQWDTQLNGHRMDETSSQNLKFVLVWVCDEGSGQTNGTVQLSFPPATTPLLLDYEDFHPRPPKPGKNVFFF